MKVDDGPSILAADSASFKTTEPAVPPKKQDPQPTNTITSSQDQSSEEANHHDWRIILYYCYIDIDLVDDHVEWHGTICQDLELKGRIRVSGEGINGVLSGRTVECKKYEDLLRAELSRLVPPEEETGEDNETDNKWELDVKYCQLRTDLPVSPQLFDSLIVKATSCVVSLFEPGLTDTNVDSETSKKKHSKQTNRRRRRQQQRRELQQQKLMLDNNLQELAQKISLFPGGQHLSPQDWNKKLCQAEDAVLLDCRNVYESNVGYFQSPCPDKTPTVLTNTRKYSDLPKVLAQSKDQWVHKKQIFMYCTGGVRCEQASKFVQALVATEQGEEEQKDVKVYQLHGGIQKYLDFHNPHSKEETSNIEAGKGGQAQENLAELQDGGRCLYRGINFVFDPRRTDPTVNSTSCVGKCCLCGTPHQDYDNGHAPVQNQEARCCKCRILLLVCPPCRLKVQSWGEEEKEGISKLFCGIDACSDYQATGASPVCVVTSNDSNC